MNEHASDKGQEWKRSSDGLSVFQGNNLVFSGHDTHHEVNAIRIEEMHNASITTHREQANNLNDRLTQIHRALDGVGKWEDGPVELIQQLRSQLAAISEAVKESADDATGLWKENIKLRSQLDKKEARIENLEQSDRETRDVLRSQDSEHTSQSAKSMRDKLAAAQAKIIEHNTYYTSCRTIKTDTTALDAAVAAAQQPLVDALTFYSNERKTRDEWQEHVQFDCGQLASDALAKVKEGK